VPGLISNQRYSSRLGRDRLSATVYESGGLPPHVAFSFSFSPADPQVVTFREAYSKAYDGSEPTAFAALGYDAARLLMTAMDVTGGSKPGDVLRGLASVEAYRGVSGTIGYPENVVFCRNP
jgi:ABC-type branched-subunit amino acid transport system substrate-binding protein